MTDCPTCGGNREDDSREVDFDSGMVEAECGDPFHDQPASTFGQFNDKRQEAA